MGIALVVVKLDDLLQRGEGRVMKVCLGCLKISSDGAFIDSLHDK